MTTFEFDSDEDDTEEYCLVAEEGSVDSNGYGSFIDSFHGYRAFHCHYKQARRYNSSCEAERVSDEAERRNGGTCEIIEITH